MTITALLMILALAAGSGISQPTPSDATTCPAGRVCKIASNCWVNGVWTTPCPDTTPPPPPSPTPEILIMF